MVRTVHLRWGYALNLLITWAAVTALCGAAGLLSWPMALAVTAGRRGRAHLTRLGAGRPIRLAGRRVG